MADIAIFRINYKSDFIITLESDAGWATPFCIKFWTGAPSQAYFVGWDGQNYTNCKVDETDASRLIVLFDDHQLPVGQLKMQMAWHTTIADFTYARFDEVMNQMDVVTTIEGEEKHVELAFEGETAPEIAFSLPAYANEAQRIANETQRIANEEQRINKEQQRIANEEQRINKEQQRITNENQRISNEEARVTEFARLKRESEAATQDANEAAVLATTAADLASAKAQLAQDAATLANQKAQLAADKAALAAAAADLATAKAQLAQEKATYAQTQGDYAKEQGDYAKAQGDTAQADHVRAEADHTTAASDHSRAEGDHTTAASDHSRAESDHTTSASDHTRAEADHTTAASDHETAASDHTRAESDHAAVEVYVDSLGAFDISSYHATGGELAKYADLTAALGTDGANIPEGIRKGGMSVKFVQSSDNKYVQYFLTKNQWSASEADWEKTNLEEEVSQVSSKVENIYTEDVDTTKEEQIWQSDSNNDTHEEYAKIGSYGVKAKGYYTLEGNSIFGSATTKYDLTADNLCGLMWDGSKVVAGGATFNGFLIELHEGRRVVYEAFGAYDVLFDHKPTIGSVGTPIKNYFNYIVPSSTQKYMLISGRLAGTQETYHIYEYGEGFSQSLMGLNGKKIAFFGDSNTEGNVAYRNIAYPNYFGIYTGADFYNFGIGGTRLYPRGGSSDYSYLDIQNLINAKVNNDLTEQRNAATSLGNAKYSAIIDMLEQTDLSTFDAIVVGGGENDFIQNVSIDNVKNSMKDIFEKLTTAYPNVKIYYVSPMFARYKVSSNPDVFEFADVYENSANYKKSDFVDWLCECAKEQMIPFYDGYHNMGWNRYNFVTYFGDNTVHPVYGYKFMAQKIGAFVTNDFIY